MKKYEEKNMLLDLKNASKKSEVNRILIKNHYTQYLHLKYFGSLYYKKLIINNEKYHHFIVILYTNCNEVLQNIKTIQKEISKKNNSLLTIINYTYQFKEDLIINQLIKTDLDIASIAINNLENTNLEISNLYSKNYPLVHVINTNFKYKQKTKLKKNKITVTGVDIFEFVIELIFELIGAILENL